MIGFEHILCRSISASHRLVDSPMLPPGAAVWAQLTVVRPIPVRSANTEEVVLIGCLELEAVYCITR